ncbi:MAG: ion transporter [Lachnospiraceae bacterium]|nr:ion transporter [Lachnospiraceae bacterium]
MKDLKKKIFNVISIGNKDDFISKAFDYFIVIIIFLNLSETFLTTFEELSSYQHILDIIEHVTIYIFTIEYILRLWTSDLLYPKLSRGKALIKFIFSFYGLIDFFAFFPFYLPIMFPAGVVAFRMFRVIRIFRLFKINSQYDAFNVITDVLKEKKNQLLSSCALIIIFMLAASLCMYSLENEAQPENFKNAFSGIWWAVSTLLTVGYGDIYPVTFWGQAMAIILAFLGVGMVAIPTGIISAGFVEHYTKAKSYNGAERPLQFVVSKVTLNHPWKDMKFKDIILPPGVILSVILRHGEVIIPTDNTVIYEEDKLVLGSSDYTDDQDISLARIDIGTENPWIGKRVKDLDISKSEMLLMIKRNKNTIVPNGSTIIKENDGIIMFSNMSE